MKVCTKCILPETYPKIEFDEQGVCNVCRSFEKNYKNIDYAQRRKDLERIIERAKKKKRDYDCMVALSGGRDSSMVLYLAVKVFGLKTLAFHYANGFFSEQAKKNMEAITKALNVDFITYRPPVDLMMKAYRTCFLKTADFCIPCNRGVTTGIYKTAFDKKIPLILLGYCSKTDAVPREVEIYEQRLLKDVLKNEMSREELYPFVFPQWKRLLVPRINLPDYFDWKETENFKKLTEEFAGVDYSGDVHFDCKVSPVATYIKKLKWGFGKREIKLAIYIRDGIISREEALSQIAERDGEPAVLDYWLKKLNLSREDLKKVKHLSYDGFKTYNINMLKFLRKYTNIVSHPYTDKI
jgi:N-acetyl sugar amidotransferase